MVEKTPEQLADERRFDVGAFAYHDTDGKLYTINEHGKRVVAQANATALSPEFQKLADQTAAILMMQSKVRALNPQDRNTLLEMVSGKRKELDQSAGEALQQTWKELKKATGFEMPGSGLMDGLNSIGSGFTVLPTFVKELFGAGFDVGNQLFGGEISREDALAFGTAYASARQVAKEGRPADYASGLFSKDWWTYTKATFSFGFDQLAGLLEKLPVIGDWVKKQGWFHDKSFSDCVEECARSADNGKVFHELTKLKEIGGLDTQKYGQLLAYGGIARGVDGRDMNIAPADSGNPAPSTPGTPTPENTAAAEAERTQKRKGLIDRLGGIGDDKPFAGTTQAMKDAGYGGMAAAAAIGAGVEHKTGIMRGTWNLGVRALTWGTQTATNITTSLVAAPVRWAGSIASWVMPSSDGLQKQLSANVDTVNEAGEKAAKQAEKAAKKAGLEGEARAKIVVEAKEQARDLAAKNLKERGAVSHVIDPLRPVGDHARAAGTATSSFIKDVGHWFNGKLDAVKSAITFDTRSAAKKAADEAVKAAAAKTAEAAAHEAATAAAQAAETAAKAEKGWFARKAVSVAETLSKFGKPGKLAAAGVLAVGGVTVAGSASAKDLVADVTGAKDLANGDYVRGAAGVTDLLSSIGVPSVRNSVDGVRQLEAMNAVDNATVTKLSSLLSAKTKATGNEYLDQAIKLMGAQARGVTKVAIAPASSPEDMGKILYEGEAINSPAWANPNMPIAAMSQAMTATVSEVIKTNLQLYIVKGGSVAKLEALLGGQHEAKATGQLKADVALHEALVAQEVRKEQALAKADSVKKIGFAFVSGTVAIGNGGIAPSAGSATGARSQVAPQPVVS